MGAKKSKLELREDFSSLCYRRKPGGSDAFVGSVGWALVVALVHAMYEIFVLLYNIDPGAGSSCRGKKSARMLLVGR